MVRRREILFSEEKLKDAFHTIDDTLRNLKTYPFQDMNSTNDPILVTTEKIYLRWLPKSRYALDVLSDELKVCGSHPKIFDRSCDVINIDKRKPAYELRLAAADALELAECIRKYDQFLEVLSDFNNVHQLNFAASDLKDKDLLAVFACPSETKALQLAQQIYDKTGIEPSTASAQHEKGVELQITAEQLLHTQRRSRGIAHLLKFRAPADGASR